MTAMATILIPIADYHLELSKRAIDSAKQQTVECKVIAARSAGTPAHVRNLADVCLTPFVVWLDADDWIEPDFVEECLKVYEEGGYVYTGYRMGNRHVTPPARDPFRNGSNHLVTTLYPTGAFRYVGGFDETLSGNEDLDFYLRSQSAGVCGVLCPKLLLHYTPDGRRSEAYHASSERDSIKQMIIERNGGTMGCCGQPGVPAPVEMGQQMQGDVLVETMWAGLRTEPGTVTGRMYRGGNHSKIWMNPEDALAMPRLYRIVQDARNITPQRAQVLKDAGLI